MSTKHVTTEGKTGLFPSKPSNDVMAWTHRDGRSKLVIVFSKRHFILLCLSSSFVVFAPGNIACGQRDYSFTKRLHSFSALTAGGEPAGLPPPEGRPGMSDVSPLSGISGLSFDSTFLSSLLFFCLVLLPFMSYRFLPAGPFF